jgi:hypothetical protein
LLLLRKKVIAPDVGVAKEVLEVADLVVAVAECEWAAA